MQTEFVTLASSGTEAGILALIKSYYCSDKTFTLEQRPDSNFNVLKEGEFLKSGSFVKKVRGCYRFGYLHTN